MCAANIFKESLTLYINYIIFLRKSQIIFLSRYLIPMAALVVVIGEIFVAAFDIKEKHSKGVNNNNRSFIFSPFKKSQDYIILTFYNILNWSKTWESNPSTRLCRPLSSARGSVSHIFYWRQVRESNPGYYL